LSAFEGVVSPWEAFYTVTVERKEFLMNRMIRLILIIVPLLVMVSSCSTMRTEKSADSFSTLADNQPYQMRVRSGHSIMDRIIYEAASLEFGKYLAISETNSYRGTIEIIFSGTSGSSFLESTTDFSTSSVAGNAWYIGSGYIGLSGTDSEHETGSTSASTVMPEKSTMYVTIKGSQEERLWIADYKYKRDLELSAFTAATEEKGAKLCIKRIVKKLKDDFPAARELTR
jgi:hypothetical protein